MSKTPEKKISKLSKTHIWPSVVFLVLSVIIAFMSFFGFVTTTTTIISEERFNSSCSDALDICRIFDGAEGNEENILGKLKDDRNFKKQIFIFDSDGNVLASVGEPTYDKSSSSTLGIEFLPDEPYILYYDTSLGSDNLITVNDGSWTIDLKRILSEQSMKKIVGSDEQNNDALFKASFWLEKEISGGRTAMVKCTPELRFHDFDRSLLMGIISLLAMVVPLIFFFVNVMISIGNQRRIMNILYTDTVTDGKSFTYFEHSAEKELSSRASQGKIFMIVDVTIMKYRSFCNFHGIRAGETFLGDVDREISAALENGEICAHSGKSSFALFMKCSDRESGKERVDELINSLDDMFGHGAAAFHAGIYFSETDKTTGAREYTDPADCFNCACAARAAVSDENVTAFAVYDDKLLEEQKWKHKVEHSMDLALKNEEFKVYLQPKYDPVSNKLAGAEALVRWINEEDGFVSPGRFIPIFEKNGFITKLDDYMLSNVSKLQAGWIAEGKKVVPVSVNISRAHFSNPDLAKHICDIVDEYKVPHNLIEIELTESAFFDDKGVLLKTVKELRALGFEISMDDFGAGYSSLNSLKDLPLDVLKLDAEFFRGENAENRGEIVVSEAISLAKKLNMRIVAEGVEKKEQVDFLADQGCDMIQGFYFAKPMPADEFEAKL